MAESYSIILQLRTFLSFIFFLVSTVSIPFYLSADSQRLTYSHFPQTGLKLQQASAELKNMGEAYKKGFFFVSHACGIGLSVGWLVDPPH